MKALKNHKNFNQDDYNYLSSKGYTNSEILKIWNSSNQHEPQPHSKVFDIVSYLNN